MKVFLIQVLFSLAVVIPFAILLEYVFVGNLDSIQPWKILAVSLGFSLFRYYRYTAKKTEVISR